MSGSDDAATRTVHPDTLEDGTVIIVDGVRRKVSRMLPTVPGLYVEANGNEWALRGDGTWVAVLGVDGIAPTHFPLAKAEPRAVTAKAVLEAVHGVATVVPDSDIRHIHVHDLIDIERDWGIS